MKLCSIILSIFVSFAIAQQQGDYDDGGWQQGDNDYYGGDRDGYYDDNNYNDDDANNNRQQKGIVNSNNVGGGWGKLLIAGVGGYILGATIHTGRLFKKKYNKKKKNKNKNGSSPPTLRFKVKQRVECNIGNGSKMKGTIIELWHQGQDGQFMPYAIRLDDGSVTYSPIDDDRAIRRVKK